MLQLPRIDNALDTINRFVQQLDNSDATSAEILSYLTESVVMTIASEYEDCVEHVFVARAMQCNDALLVHYVQDTTATGFRDPTIQNIKRHLHKFGVNYVAAFAAQLEKCPDGEAAWENVMKARTTIAHKVGSLQLTFTEILRTYPDSLNVVDSLMRVLGVSDQELVQIPRV
jgi:hypothetical protein